MGNPQDASTAPLMGEQEESFSHLFTFDHALKSVMNGHRINATYVALLL